MDHNRKAGPANTATPAPAADPDAAENATGHYAELSASSPLGPGEFAAAQRAKQALDARLAALDASRAAAGEPRPPSAGAAMGQALKLSTTLVVTVLVGGALGYGLGRLTGQMAVFVLLGLGFGMGAGFRDAIRLARQMQTAAPGIRGEAETAAPGRAGAQAGGPSDPADHIDDEGK